MNKSIEQLRFLANNPYYTMTEAEKQRLAQAESQSTTESSDPKVPSFKESATVKEIGQLNKHSGDPVSPNSMELKVNNGTDATTAQEEPVVS